MKKNISLILMVIFCSIGPGLAAAERYIDASVPTQSMHTIDGSVRALPQPSLKRHKKLQYSVPHRVARRDRATPDRRVSTIAANSAKSLPTGQATHELQQQLSSINQQMLAFGQQSSQRIDGLTAQNTQLTAQLVSLTQAVKLLNQELTALSSQQQVMQNRIQQQQQTRWHFSNLLTYQWYKTHLGRYFPLYVAGVGVLILLLLIYFSLGNKPAVKTVSGEDVGEEYDFLGSPEGIPAKLDLARAYLAMQDYVQMRAALEEVIASGNAQQQQAAKTLLDKIPEGK